MSKTELGIEYWGLWSSRLLMRVLLLLLSLSVCSISFANSLQIWTQSAASLGVFAAGSAAAANNPDTSFYNPAGSPWIQHQDMGFSLITAINDVTYRGTNNASPSISGFTDNGSVQGGQVVYLPNLFYVAPLNKKWEVGFSMTSPYRTKYHYGSDSFTRYSISSWSLKTIDLMPSVAYRFIPQLSVAVGVDFQHASLDFQQVSTTGSVANDANSNGDLADWGYGWTLGTIWQPIKNTRIGLAYHTSVHHRNAGDTTSSNNRIRSKASYDLPAWTTLSVYQKIAKSFTLLATANYTRWRDLKSLTIRSVAVPGGQRNNVLFNDLQNTWLFSLGGEYQVNSKFLLKTGVGYQQGATKNSARGIALPDVNQYIFALGTNFKINNEFNVDVGYNHYFNAKDKIQQTQSVRSGTLSSIGDVDVNSDVLGVQLNWLMT